MFGVYKTCGFFVVLHNSSIVCKCIVLCARTCCVPRSTCTVDLQCVAKKLAEIIAVSPTTPLAPNANVVCCLLFCCCFSMHA